ncbi:MAG: hypothetical protein KJZ54_04775 [Phycisphaerales bacterium]|nr:hypothetical protein [Phycisphaerales bacterium]
MRVRGAVIGIVAFGAGLGVPASAQIVIVGTPARMGPVDGDGPRRAADLIARGGGAGAQAVAPGGRLVAHINGEARAVRPPSPARRRAPASCSATG